MRMFFLLAVLTVLTFTAPAYAEIDYQDDGDYNPCFDLSYTGTDCYATGSGPQVTHCEAWAKKGQRCRTCIRSYSNSGEYLGYKVCANVNYTASCNCDNALTDSCQNKGECDYWVS